MYSVYFGVLCTLLTRCVYCTILYKPVSLIGLEIKMYHLIRTTYSVSDCWFEIFLYFVINHTYCDYLICLN